MSQYTTGEIARLAGVTVRTVQYYDSRGILIPSDFSEGGRRLYSEDDLKKLRVICFLRDLGIQINDIAEILAAENAEKVISLLLEQQLLLVEDEIAEREQKRDAIRTIQKELKFYSNFSIENLNDIAYQMKNRKKLNQTRAIVFGFGIIAEMIEAGTLCLGIIKGIWWPFTIGFIFIMLLTAVSVRYYYQKIAYICPECHEVFRPTMKQFFFANHTPTTRRLTCGACGYHGFCVETYQDMRGEE